MMPQKFKLLEEDYGFDHERVPAMLIPRFAAAPDRGRRLETHSGFHLDRRKFELPTAAYAEQFAKAKSDVEKRRYLSESELQKKQQRLDRLFETLELLHWESLAAQSSDTRSNVRGEPAQWLIAESQSDVTRRNRIQITALRIDSPTLFWQENLELLLHLNCCPGTNELDV